MTSRNRLGIFGGSFDPVHIGHLVAAQQARFSSQLDEVLLVVAGEPWQKTGERVIGPAELRYAAVAAAVGNVEGLTPSRMEIDREGPSYTADTLMTLQEQRPDDELFLILGADAAAKLPTWHRAEEVAALAEIIVVNRLGSEIEPLDDHWRVSYCTMPNLEISSTDLRRRLAGAEPVDFLIPWGALQVLRAEG